MYVYTVYIYIHVYAGGWFSVRAFLRFLHDGVGWGGVGWGGVGWGGVGWADNVQWHLHT